MRAVTAVHLSTLSLLLRVRAGRVLLLLVLVGLRVRGLLVVPCSALGALLLLLLLLFLLLGLVLFPKLDSAEDSRSVRTSRRRKTANVTGCRTASRGTRRLTVKAFLASRMSWLMSKDTAGEFSYIL